MNRLLPEKTEGQFSHEGIAWFVLFLGLVPLTGIGAAVASLVYAVGNWESNEFNLARQAAYTSYITLLIQLVYIVALAVIYL